MYCFIFSFQTLSYLQVFQEVEGACYDLDYARETVSNVASLSHFQHIAQLLDSAIHLTQQLEAVESGKIERLSQQATPKFSNTQGNTDSSSLAISPRSFD